MTAAVLIARMTVRQVLALRRLLGLGALAALPAVIVYFSTGRMTEASRLDTFLDLTIGLLFGVVVPVVTLILAASAMGDERRDQTLSFIVLRPVRRGWIAAAKIGGAIAASCVVTGLGAVALAAAMGLRSDDWSFVVPLVAGAWIATATYGALFTPLGYLTERATLAGLAFVFIWESAVSGNVAALATLSPWRVGFSAFVALAPDNVGPLVDDFALGNVVPGAGGALAKAVVVFLLGTALTTWILRTRDLA